MNIGETIRNYRLQKGMSQGDIEKRTGLLRCYLSRVENGHTIPSLDTLSKIAGAMDLALSQFFSEGHSNGHKGLPQTGLAALGVHNRAGSRNSGDGAPRSTCRAARMTGVGIPDWGCG